MIPLDSKWANMYDKSASGIREKMDQKVQRLAEGPRRGRKPQRGGRGRGGKK